MQIISRAEARARGLKRYFTGRACSRGHISERYVSKGTCVQCNNHDKAKRALVNKEHVKKQNALWHAANREYNRERYREWYFENRDRRRAQRKEWGAANHAHLREWHRARHQERYASEPDYRLAMIARRMLRRLVEGGVLKHGRTFDVLGYGTPELKAHIELQFLKGMSWDNYGEWHIDRIVPVAEHIRNGETDPAVINCLTNLRPMWAEDNMSKSDKRTHLL